MRSLAILCVGGWFAVCTGVAHAQFPYSGGGGTGASWSGRSTGSSGMFGSRNVGQGGLQRGQPSFTGSGGGNSMQQMGNTAGQLTGNERYVRGNRQAGQFVGGDGGDTAFVGAGGAQGLGGGQMGMNQFGLGQQGFGGMGGGFGGQMFGQQNRFGQQPNRNNAGRNRSTVRVAIELGFTPPVANHSVASERLTGLLQRSSRIAAVTPLEVEMQGATAILRGTVTSAADRDLARQVVLLEPGISQVQNELVVAAPTAEPLPAPRPDR